MLITPREFKASIKYAIHPFFDSSVNSKKSPACLSLSIHPSMSEENHPYALLMMLIPAFCVRKWITWHWGIFSWIKNKCANLITIRNGERNSLLIKIVCSFFYFLIFFPIAFCKKNFGRNSHFNLDEKLHSYWVDKR